MKAVKKSAAAVNKTSFLGPGKFCRPGTPDREKSMEGDKNVFRKITRSSRSRKSEPTKLAASVSQDASDKIGRQDVRKLNLEFTEI